MRVSPAPRHSFQVVELEPRLTPAGLFTVPPPDTVDGPVQLRFEWGGSDAQFRSEFGIYNVDDAAGRVNGLLPTDPGYAGVALGRAKAILAKGDGFGAKAELTTAGGQLLGFYLVPNATTLEAQEMGATVFFSFAGANADKFDHVQTVDRGDGGRDFRFEDQFGGGDQDFNDAIISVARTHAVATPGQAGQTVQANFTRLAAKPGLSGEVGVFKVDGRDGSVGGLAPGTAGYLQAVFGSAGRRTIFSAGSADTDRSLTLDGGALYGFYFLTFGSAEQFRASNATNGAVAYFSFSDANPDKLDHINWRSGNTFGVEDQLGGGDKGFDDGVFQFSFGRPQGTPTSPPASPPPPPATGDTTAPVATFALGNDTGASNTDLITRDPRGTLTVTDDSGTIASLLAGFGAADVDILSRRAADGTVTVDTALLTQLNHGVTLPDGPRTLFVEATDPSGNKKVFQFPLTVDNTVPVVSYALTVDSGASATDRVTNDARGTLTVTDATSAIATLRAGFGTADIDILSRRQANGTIAVDTALLTQLNHGVTLPDGPRTLLVQATDTAGNLRSFQFQFTLDTNGAPNFDLAPSSDTGTIGDLRTDNATVNLTGTGAPAGGVLQLTVPAVPGTPGTGTVLATATAAADGTFTFTNVALNVGPNSYTVRAVSGVDVAGNAAGNLSLTFVRNTPPTVANPPQNLTAATGGPAQTVDLTNVFTDAERVLRFATTRPGGVTGNLDVQLFVNQAPNTVANILAYVNSVNPQQDFNGSIFHRLVPGFVLQGGGFNFDPNGTDTATTFPTIPKLPPVNNEPGVSNTRGTLAMAKGSNPNSATSEFFFNLGDNSTSLNNAANAGGFTVFGQVMNGGQQTLDNIVNAVTTTTGNGGQLPGAPPFPVAPGANLNNFPLNLTANDLVTITTAKELTAAQRMRFNVTSSNLAVAGVSVDANGTLSVSPGAVGTSTITVTATDLDGSTATATFQFTVS